MTQTSYVTWSGDEAITVKYEAYGNAESGGGCEEKAQHCEEDQDYYPKNKVMYTKESPWPYNKDEVCRYRYVFTNDLPINSDNVEIYTFPAVPEGAVAGLLQSGFVMLTSVTASLLIATL